jgi:hypothetical protein
MKRIEDFRVGELRIPADRFPLPPRVEELLQAYSGFGQWEGAPYGVQSVAVFELPMHRLTEIERAFEDAAGETR